MNVFIVSRGETYEGSRVKGIFSTIEKARAFAEAMRTEMSADFHWRNTQWKEEAPDYWEFECDFVKIETKEVL
jgi:hypothetical protein